MKTSVGRKMPGDTRALQVTTLAPTRITIGSAHLLCVCECECGCRCVLACYVWVGVGVRVSARMWGRVCTCVGVCGCAHLWQM